MTVNGVYMASRVRWSAILSVHAYGQCVLRDILSAFANLDKRANDIAEAEFESLSSAPVGEDWGGDMAVLAESAQDKAIAFYETMVGLRQATLNLYSAGLFHLVEQCLADLCCDSAFTVAPLNDTKLDVVRKWIGRHFGFDLRKIAGWSVIDELRLVANAVKHAEGASAATLRKLRPELFQNPVLHDFPPSTWSTDLPIRIPLAGDGLYITEKLFEGYWRAANQFFTDIADHFEAHGSDHYPSGS